jgi:hypothetical protein
MPEWARVRVRVGTQVEAIDPLRLRSQRAQVHEHAIAVEAKQRFTRGAWDENGGVRCSAQPQLLVAVDDLCRDRAGGGRDAADLGLEVRRHRGALTDMRERRAGQNERRDYGTTRDEHAPHASVEPP